MEHACSDLNYYSWWAVGFFIAVSGLTLFPSKCEIFDHVQDNANFKLS